MNHINKKGNPYIVDVSNKDITERIAIASGEIKFDKLTYKKINSFKTKKGNLEKTAIIAGIMGAKETSRLIPLCHNIPINHINIDVKKNDKGFSLIIKSTVKTHSNTGVEMEALTAVTISCLTIYDMCKYLNKKIKIQNIHLVSKTGGKSNI
jgi:cyclic pyranopterin phosphate synthase